MQVIEFPDFSLSGLGVHFVPYRKDEIRSVRKKSRRLITLYDSYFHISAPHSIGGFCCHMYWLIDRLRLID